MIKRYGMGVQSIPLGDGVSLNVPDITEKQDGDYVRYEDYLALLEAIGAGGVSSERITQQNNSLERRTELSSRRGFQTTTSGCEG